MKSNQQKQTALAIAAALATAWIATGNAGLLSHPVRHLLALLGAATVATLVAANPKRREAAPLLRSTAVAIGCFMLYRVLLFSVPPFLEPTSSTCSFSPRPADWPHSSPRSKRRLPAPISTRTPPLVKRHGFPSCAT